MTRNPHGPSGKVIADLRTKLDAAEAEAQRTARELETLRILVRSGHQIRVGLEAERDLLAAAVQRVRDVHCDDGTYGPGYCEGCGEQGICQSATRIDECPTLAALHDTTDPQE